MLSKWRMNIFLKQDNQPIYNSQLEMSALKSLINQLLHSNQTPSNFTRQPLYKQTIALSLSDLQQLIRELSYILYQKQQQSKSLLNVLQFVKQLLLTASLPLYLLINVYIFPWIISINKLHADRPLAMRAQMLSQNKVGKKVQDYQQLLLFSSQFVVFFGQNMSFHPYSKFKIKNSLAKQLSQGSYSKSKIYFTQQSLLQLQENLQSYSSVFRDHLKQLTQFLSQKVEECLTDSTKYNQVYFLLLSIIETSQSYCITTIIYRLSSFVYTPYLLTVCQLVHAIISQGEIQAIQLLNIKFLPCMLQYLLPVDFKNNEILPTVRYVSNTSTLNQLADYFYIWFDKTKLATLSTKIYQYSNALIEQLKKPNKLSYQNQLHLFSQKLSSMKMSNDVKRNFILEQNKDTQNYIVNLLRQVQFCVISKRKQRIAYQNVLDQLTLTEKNSFSQKISAFSQSLLRQVNQSKGEIFNDKIQKKLQGPPHKKFEEFNDSISEVASHYFKPQLQSSKSRQNLQPPLQFKRESPKLSVFYNRARKSNIEQSFKHVKQTQIPIVAAKNSPYKSPIFSSQIQSLSFKSSCFSQKQNNLNSPRSKNNSPQIQIKQQSGDFIHFENDSLAKTEKKFSQHSIAKPQEEQINFSDSLQIQKSTSQSIIEYGIDRNAKLPPTMKKPKFAFKIADTNDSSIILKNLESSVKQLKKSQPVSNQIVTAIKNDIQKLSYEKKSTKILFQDKKATSLKFIQESKTYKSPKKSAEEFINSNIATYKDQRSNNSPYINKNQIQSSNKSSSIINDMSAEPYLNSEGSSSNLQKVPSNFGSLFKRNKKKQQKASSICSSHSLRKIRSVQRQIQMPDLKKMRELQNQLGKLKNETQNVSKILTEKQKQKKQLQKIKNDLGQQDPYLLKRQNEIMKKILKNRKNNALTLSSHSSAQLLSQELKTSSIKNTNKNLKDYNPQILKLRLENIKAYEKQTKKNIVANRCFLIKNDLIEVGYSFKNKILTLYFTLKQHCDSLDINLEQNSIIYSQGIQRQFDRVVIGRQIKFKTQVQGTKDEPKFTPSQLQVKLTYEQKLSKKTQVYSEELPLTPYNLASPQAETSFHHLSEHKDSITHYVTPLFHSCEDLLRKGSKYLFYLFPHGDFDDNTNTFKVHYVWKGRGEQIRLKIKQRMFRLEGVGHPLQTGRQLIQSIINMLLAHT